MKGRRLNSAITRICGPAKCQTERDDTRGIRITGRWHGPFNHRGDEGATRRFIARANPYRRLAVLTASVAARTDSRAAAGFRSYHFSKTNVIEDSTARPVGWCGIGNGLIRDRPLCCCSTSFNSSRTRMFGEYSVQPVITCRLLFLVYVCCALQPVFLPVIGVMMMRNYMVRFWR